MSERYIIDGNNLVHAFREHARQRSGFDFERARRELTKRLYRFAAESGCHVTLVYDGTVGGREPEFQAPDFEAVYSSELSSADHIIEEHLAGVTDPHRTTVVTSDWAIQTATRAADALVLPCRAFIEQLASSGADVQAALKRPNRQRPRPTLGDLFP
jgi:predicted RNA-binding protein with PIN domain